MTAPRLTLTVVDGGLGTAANTDRLVACFGVSSAGEAGTLAFFTDPATLVAEYGYGPGPSLAAHVIRTSGQGVIFGKASEDVGSSASGVAHEGTGASTLTPSLASGSGQYHDSYDVLVTIATGGTAGTTICRATVSLDGGLTTLGTFAIPTATRAIALPTCNLKMTFSAATLVAGDTYAFTTTAPRSTATDTTPGSIVDLIGKLQAYAATHFGTYPSVIADADYRDAAAVAAIQSACESAAAGYEYARAVTSARPWDQGAETQTSWAADLADDFVSTDALRVVVGAGLARVYDSLSGAYLWRTLAFPIAHRAASTKAHIDAAWVALGSCPGVQAIDHDERLAPGLDSARFATMTSLVGQSGYFVANARLMAPPTSDYQFLQYGRVMDKICRTTYGYFLQTLSQAVRLNPSTGTILEADAQQLEQGCNGRLKAQVISDGNVSSAVCTVSRTDNLAIPDAPFHAQVAAVPLGYLKQIQVDLFFVNPAANAA